MLALVTPTHAKRAAPEVVHASLLNASGLGVADPAAPAVAQQRTAYRGIVGTLARLRANAVAEAMLGAEAARRTAPDEFEPVGPAEPWARLLRSPHPSFSPRYLWAWAQQAKDLGRGAFFFIERDRAGRPLYLHPVYPSFGEVNPVGGPSGEVAAYVFHRADGARQTWAARDVAWIRHPHPVSPYESASVLELSSYEADTDLWAHVYARDLMKRGGAPMLQITTDQDLLPSDAKELEDRVSPKILNQNATKRVPIFGKGARVETIGLSPKDMESTELRGLTRTELFQIWGVPEGLLSDHANRANADAARYTFAGLTVQGEADDFADQLTTALRLAFAADGAAPDSPLTVRAPRVTPLDPDYVLREREMEIRHGITTPNAILEATGRDPYPGGDVPMVSSLLVPVRDVVAPASPREPQASPAANEPDTDDDEPRALLRLTGTLRSLRAERGEDDAEATLGDAWRALDTEKRRAERTVEAVASALLIRMGEEAVSRMPEARAREALITADLLLDIGAWITEVARTLAPSLARALRRGFESGALSASVDLAFDPTTQAARSALAEVVALTRSVPETAHGYLSTALRDGLAAGDDVAGLTKRVRVLFKDLSGWQARRIAQTSATDIFEAGQVQAFREAEVPRHRWLSQRDGKVRPAHDKMDGEEVEPGEEFSNGRTHPGEPNCRCTLLPVFTEPRALSGRDAFIVAEYPALKEAHGRGVALTKLRDAIASRVEPDGWAPIGERQILRIAKGHAA